MTQPDIGIIMGSQSDWPTLRNAAEILDDLHLPYETKIVSGFKGDYCRRWWGSAFAWHDGVKNPVAGDWRAHTNESLIRCG